MNCYATSISLLATLFVSQSAFAGPEGGLELLAVSPATFADSGEIASTEVPSVSNSFEELLAVPSFADPHGANPDLVGAEHPMIPLPSHAVAGFMLFAGVATYVLRQQQRTHRLR